jgi:quercetin dioxygenase-like cupin family protein
LVTAAQSSACFGEQLIREKVMEAINRRSTLALGLTMAAAPLIVGATTSAAQTYGPDEGKELAPGVRQVDLSERESVIPAYKMVKMRDIVIQPGAKTPDNVMKNDMVCHLTEGELAVVQNGKEFTVKKGDVWTCANADTTEGTNNKSDAVAIMRVTDLMTA